MPFTSIRFGTLNGMITFFTTFKNFGRVEANSVNSWLSLHSETEVIVFTETNVVNSIDNQRLVLLDSFPKHNDRLPVLNALFSEASKRAKHQILCYCNADIILIDDFIKRIQNVLRLQGNFLGISQRLDLDVEFLIDFTSASEVKAFALYSKAHGKIHPPTGSDIFLFPKHQYGGGKMPELVVGRPGWDNWMIYDARRRFNKLINLNVPNCVVHQNHESRYDSQKLDHQVNFKFLPGDDIYTFVSEYCNLLLDSGRIRYQSLKNIIRSAPKKRRDWEVHFHRGSIRHIQIILITYYYKVKRTIAKKLK